MDIKSSYSFDESTNLCSISYSELKQLLIGQRQLDLYKEYSDPKVEKCVETEFDELEKEDPTQ